MSSKLFPVHGFTEFKKYEITNRMECLINKVQEACIEHCNSIPEESWSQFRSHSSKGNLEDRFKCYEEHEVSTYAYGREYCGVMYNKTTNYDKFYYCISFNQVRDITLKEAC